MQPDVAEQAEHERRDDPALHVGQVRRHRREDQRNQGERFRDVLDAVQRARDSDPVDDREHAGNNEQRDGHDPGVFRFPPALVAISATGATTGVGSGS